MTTLVNAAPLSIIIGASEIGPLSLPVGSRQLLVTYSNVGWPAVADGTITVTLMISDNNGATYRNEWSDTFRRVSLSRGGVLQTQASFGIGLQAPFGATSKLKVAFTSTVLVVTTVTVTAN